MRLTATIVGGPRRPTYTGARRRPWTTAAAEDPRPVPPWLVVIAALQLLTTPVAAHMVGRAAYRTGQVRDDLLVTDELTTALEPDDTGES